MAALVALAGRYRVNFDDSNSMVEELAVAVVGEPGRKSPW